MTTFKIYNHQIVDGRIPDYIIRAIPAGTTRLDLSDCTSLTTLAGINFPAGLNELNLSGCTGLTTLPENLPQDLKILNLSGCTSLTTLPESLPQDLKILDLFRCTGLTTLPENLPQDLKILDLFGCTSLETIKSFPADLESLILFRCSSLRTLPPIPKNIISLNLSFCENLTSLPKLPEGLKELKLSWCYNLTTLQNLPESLTNLIQCNCQNLTNLPKLPAGLKKLDLSGATSLITLRELPAGLNELNLVMCSSLTTLPDLPEGLQYLNVSGCSSLRSLPDLPEGLLYLDLKGCSSLRTLPDLPANIDYLDLTGCIDLKPESIPKLLALEYANRDNPRFTLIWPQHLVINNKAIAILKESYRTYYANDPVFTRIEPTADHPTNFQTLKLFHRFTSERLAERDEIEIIAQANLVAEEIKKNPELLEILDKASEYYLRGCVNQPVNGFLEIASLMAIAREDNMTAKIAKAKILRAQQLIKHGISSLQNSSNQTVGAGFEVELGNAMIREVHNKLFTEKFIKEPWLGIPRNISYERSIRSFLTAKNIADMTNLAQKALSDENSEQEAIEFLCSIQTEFWKKMVFSKKERQAFDQKHNEKIQQLRMQILELNPNDAGESDQISKLVRQIGEIETKKSTQFVQTLIQRTLDLLREHQQIGILLDRVSMRKHYPLSQSMARARSVSPRPLSSPRSSPTNARDNPELKSQDRRNSI